MSSRPLVGWVLVLALTLAGGSAASAQKDKDKVQKQPKLAEAYGVTRIEYAPDGSFILMDYKAPHPERLGSTLPSVGIWDAKTGEFRTALEKPGRCERLAISADGKKVASVSIGGMDLKVWEAATGKLLDEQKLPEWKGFILHAPFLKFSADGTTLYSMWSDQLLEMKVGGKNRLFTAKTGRYYTEHTAFDSNTNRLVVVSNVMGMQASSLDVYDATKEGEPQKVPLNNHVMSIAFAPDGKTLALSYMRGLDKPRFELWDATAWKLKAAGPMDTRKEFQNYRWMVYSPDGKMLAGVPRIDKDGVTNLIDVLDAGGKVTREISKAGARVAHMAFSPDGKTLAVVLNTGAVVFYDPVTGDEKKP